MFPMFDVYRGDQVQVIVDTGLLAPIRARPHHYSRARARPGRRGAPVVEDAGAGTVGIRTLGPFPQAVLLHQQTARLVGGGSIRTYTSTPLTMPRPASGRSTRTVSCPSCRSPLAMRVCSVRDTRLRRLAWLALAAAGAGLVAALIAFAGQGSGANGGLVALGLFAGVAAACVGLARWYREDGVAITRAERPSPFTADGAEHLVGFPTVGGATYTRRGRARIVR